jgi:arylsulfatase A-like enzyme
VAPGQLGARVKGSGYEGGINVPLIVAGPGVARGRRCAALVSLTDLYATVLELLHAPVPAGAAVDSVSFVPQLTLPDLPGRKWIWSQWFRPNGPAAKTAGQRAVVSRRFKLLTDGASELVFDLENDPDERHPLSLPDHPRIAAGLRLRHQSMLAQGAP